MQKFRISNSASRNLFEGNIKDMTVIVLLQGYAATTLYNGNYLNQKRYSAVTNYVVYEKLLIDNTLPKFLKQLQNCMYSRNSI